MTFLLPTDMLKALKDLQHNVLNYQLLVNKNHHTANTLLMQINEHLNHALTTAYGNRTNTYTYRYVPVENHWITWLHLPHLAGLHNYLHLSVC